MSNPLVIWFASVIGWEVGPTVSLITIFFIVGYVFAFMMLFEIVSALVGAFKQASIIGKLITLVFLIPFGALFIVLDVIHTLLLIWLGIQALVGLNKLINRHN